MKKNLIIVLSLLIILFTSNCIKEEEKNIQPPTAIDQTFTLDENSPKDKVVGTIVAQSPDESDKTLEYSMLKDDYNGAFSINKNTGEIKVVDPTLLDYEKTKSFIYTILVNRPKVNISLQIKITIILIDINEPPIASDQIFTLNENSPKDKIVGTIVAQSLDENDKTLEYSMLKDDYNGAFSINKNTGEIKVVDPTLLDYEKTKSFIYTILINRPNVNISIQIKITINLIDISEIINNIDLTTGLVAYYPFNGNAMDSSGNNNNGTVYGATLTSDKSGNANSSYLLDGINDYVEINNSSSLNSTNAISICAWYKSDYFIGYGFTPILSKCIPTYVYPYYQYKLGFCGDYTTHNSQYNIGFALTINDSLYGVATTKNYWTVGNWYFIVATYDGSLIKLYVNNQLIQSKAITGQMNNYSTPIILGNNLPTWPNDYLKGIINDIRIYNIALSEKQIEALYNK